MRRRVVPLVAILLVGIAPTPTLANAPTLPSPKGGGLKAESGINSPYVADAMTTQQYHLSASDGQTWHDIDSTNLSITIHAPANVSVVLMGNADLWTANRGYNQDLGIAVSGGVAPNLHYPTVAGQPEAWKESGGFAGTLSPNAAFVQTVIDVSANQDYTVRLQWKTNKRDPGTIYAGAGPLPNSATYSNTRLTAHYIPAGWEVYTTESRDQYGLAGSDGKTFQPVDPAKLDIVFTPQVSGTAFFEVNADLWTPARGYNQDIGVQVTPFPNSTNMATWKESGGFAGTFSPNAAFAQGSIPINAGTPYTAEVVAKANKFDPYPIVIGAGPIAGAYSPTTLTVTVIPSAGDAVDFGQLRLDNSDGVTWQPMDQPTALLSGANSSVDCVVIVGVNADLFTASAGYNQDLAIIETIGTDPTEHVLAWKESGGFAGTFSPNAAFVEAVVQVSANTLYQFRPKWKQNREAPGNSIYAGAGPWPPVAPASWSPTRITAKPFGCM